MQKQQQGGGVFKWGVPFYSVLCTEWSAAVEMGGWGHASCSSAVREGNGRVITAVFFYKTTYTLANWTHPATCKMQRTGCFHIVKSW